MTVISKAYKRVPYQVRASIVILIASFATSAISFLTTPVFTRLMSVEEYGLVVEYNSVLEVITVIATLSLSAGVYQVAMNEYSDDRNVFTFSAMILSNITTTIVFAILMAFKDQTSSLFKVPTDLIQCMYIYLMFYPAMQMWMAKQRYEYQYKKVAVVSIVSTAFSLGIGVVALCVVKDANLGAVKVWTTSMALVICSAVIYFSIAKEAKWKPKWKYIKYAFTFNAPLLIHYLAQYVLRSSDKIMITKFCGERATGLYGLGTTVASIAIMAWGAMAASLTPYMYAHVSKKEYNKVNKAAVGVILIFGACCVVVSLIGPEVIYILGSEKYSENIGLIPPIAASSLLSGVYGVYSTIAFYHHKRTSTAIMTIFAALLNIVLNYILIPQYGYMAAAYTTEAAYLVYTFLHFLNYRNIVKKERIFDDKVIWGITVISTILCMVSGFLYSARAVRYAILFVTFIGVVLARKKVIATIKQFSKQSVS